MKKGSVQAMSNHIVIRDLNDAERDLLGIYGGKSGFKYGIILDGERWMVKFPESSKGFAGQSKKNNHIPSYTTSPLSEYIGSHIYASVGIPVHETMLGYRNGKIVVACKDFDLNHEFIDFEKIRNSLEEMEGTFLGSSGSSGFHGEFLRDALTVIDHSELLRRTPGALERFWDMFVIDGFIRNNDRNNGNWGILAKKDGTLCMAPVFDNGNAFFNKRNPSVAARRLQDEESIAQDALGTSVSFFLTDDERHIHPFEYIESLQNQDCTDALLRFAEKLDMGKVWNIIDSIPETAFGLNVISKEQKELYYRMMEVIVTRSINPTLERLGRSPVSLGRDESCVSLKEETRHARAASQALENHVLSEPHTFDRER